MTRPPERIQVILAELEEYWEANPDLRLGQIVAGAAQAHGDVDPFYLEDTALDAFLSARNKRRPLYRVTCNECELSVLHVVKSAAEDAKDQHNDRTGHIAHIEEVKSNDP